MKKFSNIDEKEQVIKEQKPKINKLVEYLSRENLQVAYNGDADEAITKKLTIDGFDNLTEKLNDFIHKMECENESKILESLKYKFGNQHDQKELNRMIECCASNLYLDIVPSPFDIFSSEDYEQVHEDTILLRSLNNMPSDYLDYVNYQNANKFFESGMVKLRYAGPGLGWELFFENKGEYGTVIDSNNDKYKKFLSENKDFVADFLRATKELIGTQNMKLENILISQI